MFLDKIVTETQGFPERKVNINLWEKPPQTDEEKIQFIIASFTFSKGKIPRHACWYNWQEEHWKKAGYNTSHPIISLQEFTRLMEKYRSHIDRAYERVKKHKKPLPKLDPDSYAEQWKHLLDTAGRDRHDFPDLIPILSTLTSHEQLEPYIKY